MKAYSAIDYLPDVMLYINGKYDRKVMNITKDFVTSWECPSPTFDTRSMSERELSGAFLLGSIHFFFPELILNGNGTQVQELEAPTRNTPFRTEMLM